MVCARVFAVASAGSSIAARMAMIAMTTSSSIKVNPRPRRIGFSMEHIISQPPVKFALADNMELTKGYSRPRCLTSLQIESWLIKAYRIGAALEVNLEDSKLQTPKRQNGKAESRNEKEPKNVIFAFFALPWVQIANCCEHFLCKCRRPTESWQDRIIMEHSLMHL
jgi:hypothetical protein